MYDTLKRFPNQDIEKRGTECVGETVADILGNIFATPMHAGFSYATAIKTSRSAPSTLGSDPYAGMLGGVVYGALPIASQDFDATTTSELFEANFDNYSKEDVLTAQSFPAKGLKNLATRQQISSHLHSTSQGVSLAMKWYQSFNFPSSDGLLPAPQGNITFHNVAVYDDPFGNLLLKPWKGPNFGKGGYALLTPSQFSQVFIGAWGFDTLAWRWLSLAIAGVSRPWLIPDILPQLKNTNA